LGDTVSPPFEGGVAGIADFEMFIILLPGRGGLKRIQQKWTYFSFMTYEF
jgi:hypothetical protein